MDAFLIISSGGEVKKNPVINEHYWQNQSMLKLFPLAIYIRDVGYI